MADPSPPAVDLHDARYTTTSETTTAPPARPALPNIEPKSAPATRIRVVINDLIHLILGQQLTTRTPMPALPTSLAALAFSHPVPESRG